MDLVHLFSHSLSVNNQHKLHKQVNNVDNWLNFKCNIYFKKIPFTTHITIEALNLSNRLTWQFSYVKNMSKLCFSYTVCFNKIWSHAPIGIIQNELAGWKSIGLCCAVLSNKYIWLANQGWKFNWPVATFNTVDYAEFTTRLEYWIQCSIRTISLDTLHWLPMLKGTLNLALPLIHTKKNCTLMGTN